MITKFEVRNMTTDDRITFGQDLDCDYLYQSKGIDWGNASATHNTYNYPGQVGVSIYSSKINERDVSITAWVYYVLSAEERETLSRGEWEAYAYEKIKKKKDILSGVFNPADVLRITTGGYYIEGKPAASVKYGIEDSDNNIYFCKFKVTIYCNNPMFKKETIVKKAVVGDTPAWAFPWALTSQGVVFGTRVDYLMLAVENEGNVAIGGRIILTAKGTVVNPSITNVETGERMIVNKTMVAGEKIVITTVDGKDRGIVGTISGVEQNYLKYWNFNNAWMKFQKGTTLIEYATENQAEEKLEVVVEINPEKYNLEEM